MCFIVDSPLSTYTTQDFYFDHCQLIAAMDSGLGMSHLFQKNMHHALYNFLSKYEHFHNLLLQCHTSSSKNAERADIKHPSIKHPISDQSIPTVKGCMDICFDIGDTPLIVEEHLSSPSFFRTLPR